MDQSQPGKMAGRIMSALSMSDQPSSNKENQKCGEEFVGFCSKHGSRHPNMIKGASLGQGKVLGDVRGTTPKDLKNKFGAEDPADPLRDTNKRRPSKRCRFTSAEILEFDPSLYASGVPVTGGPALGMSSMLRRRMMRRVDSFESERLGTINARIDRQRFMSEGYVPPEHRRRILSLMGHRRDSFEEVERECNALLEQRRETVEEEERKEWEMWLRSLNEDSTIDAQGRPNTDSSTHPASMSPEELDQMDDGTSSGRLYEGEKAIVSDELAQMVRKQFDLVGVASDAERVVRPGDLAAASESISVLDMF